MLYQRDCILTLSQRARESTGPDTLLDASERLRANTTHTIAFDIEYFLATVHACVARSFAARSRRYAARMQRCTSEQELAMLPISVSCAPMRSEVRAAKASAQAEPPAPETIENVQRNQR